MEKENDDVKFYDALSTPTITMLTEQFLTHQFGSSQEDIDHAIQDINNIFHTGANIAKICKTNMDNGKHKITSKQPHKKKNDKNQKKKVVRQ
jgi:hypothetical protein